MSRKININKLSEEERNKITKELQITINPSKYAFNAAPSILCLFDLDDKDVILPFAYSKYPRPDRKEFNNRSYSFQGELRDQQKEVMREAVDNINKTGSVIISAYTGFGKTAMSIYIASRIKMKTLIVCHRIVLIQQWKDSIKKFCPEATIQVLSTQSKMLDCDFYIANATTIPKHPKNFYKSIGFVIVDEIHVLMAEKMSQFMKFIFPRYVLGLSATPYRTDGLDILLDMYYGKLKIIRKLFHKHTVYRFNTDIVPDVKLNRMGKIDWGSVIDSISNNQGRNEIIINIVKFFKNRVFLILCKRVAQANYIFERLQEEKEDVTSLIGKQQDYEQTSRILVGTAQKTGVGFDHPRLDTLLLACDVEQYFVQYLGRVFRRQDVEPIIFDLLDNHPILLKHFKTRNATYIEHGGTVKDFRKEFPNFFRLI